MVGIVIRALTTYQCNEASVQMKDKLPHSGSSLLLVLVLAFILEALWFSPLLENQDFQIPMQSGISNRQGTSFWKRYH